MKIEYKNNSYIVYLNKYNTINIDFSDSKALEKDLKNLLLRLKKHYKLNINGYCNITVYTDDNYGAILKIKEDNNYYDYFDDTLIVRIKKVKQNFLYEIDDISYINEYINKFKIDSKDGKLYLSIIDHLSECEYLKLTEMSNIIFDK